MVPSPGLLGHLWLEGMHPPAPEAVSIVSRAAVRLQVAVLGRLGWSPTPRTPSATLSAAIWLHVAPLLAPLGCLGLEGTRLPAPWAPSLISRAAVKLPMAPLGRMGLEGTHPPAPKAPSMTLYKAMKLCVAPLPALLGHLGWRGGVRQPQGASLDLWASCQAASGAVGLLGAGWDTSPAPSVTLCAAIKLRVSRTKKNQNGGQQTKSHQKQYVYCRQTATSLSRHHESQKVLN